MFWKISVFSALAAVSMFFVAAMCLWIAGWPPSMDAGELNPLFYFLSCGFYANQSYQAARQTFNRCEGLVIEGDISFNWVCLRLVRALSVCAALLLIAALVARPIPLSIFWRTSSVLAPILRAETLTSIVAIFVAVGVQVCPVFLPAYIPHFLLGPIKDQVVNTSFRVPPTSPSDSSGPRRRR